MRSFLSLKKDCLKVRNYGQIFSPGSESGFRRENECRFMQIRIHSHGHGHHKHLKKVWFRLRAPLPPQHGFFPSVLF